MIEERFLAQQQLGIEVPSTNCILFYRDGRAWDTKMKDRVAVSQIIKSEMTAITAGAREFLGPDVDIKLAYILVNKNVEKPVRIGVSDTSDPEPVVKPRLWFTTETDDLKAKYIYHVFGDDY